ncbi:MAG TPA: alpha/beta fold hydrolase, partial [Longimicrobiaceae bacterium]|nr:alpha/beta fold hydrolase [Longimicrobiaceae bacterium]
ATVEAAAGCYLRALREAHPAGPVHLLGHSFGGWVAFEMALRLHRAGRPVASLTLVDSEAPDGGHGREYDDGEALLQLVEAFEQVAERALEIGPRSIESLNAAGRLKLLHERLAPLGLVPWRSEPEVLRGLLRTFAAGLRASYTPAGTFPGPLRLVLVDDPRLDLEGNRRQREEGVEAWKRWAPGLVHGHGPGSHFTVLKAPHVRGLAACLLDSVPTPGA